MGFVTPAMQNFERNGTAAAREPFSEERESWSIPFEAWPYLAVSLRLSNRELQIVKGIFADRELEEIAHDNGANKEFVYRSLQRIFIKLGIGSRAELVVRVMAEYLAFAADQEQSEFSGLPYWPIK
jgi:hypothetical protein